MHLNIGQWQLEGQREKGVSSVSLSWICCSCLSWQKPDLKQNQIDRKWLEITKDPLSLVHFCKECGDEIKWRFMTNGSSLRWSDLTRDWFGRHTFPPPWLFLASFRLDPDWIPEGWPGKYARRPSPSSCSGYTFDSSCSGHTFDSCCSGQTFNFCFSGHTVDSSCSGHTFDILTSHCWTFRCCWLFFRRQLLPRSHFQEVIDFMSHSAQPSWNLVLKFSAPRGSDCVSRVLQLGRFPPAGASLRCLEKRNAESWWKLQS